MKIFNLILLLSVLMVACKPPMNEELNKINNALSAQTFIKNYPELNGEFITFESTVDSSSIAKMLFASNKSSVVTTNNHLYKIIDSISSPIYRCNYIFFDGNIYGIKSIDSLRKIALNKLKNNVPFPVVANEYAMDKNASGDTKWFDENTMVPEFTEAVKNHSVNELFTLDIPDKYWYFIVCKTYENNVKKKLIVLKLNKENK